MKFIGNVKWSKSRALNRPTAFTDHSGMRGNERCGGEERGGVVGLRLRR